MLRRLLACLAFLTGLAAAGVPAQAMVEAAGAVQVSARASVPATAAMPVRPAAPAAPFWAARTPHSAPRYAAWAPAAPVRVRVDRARE